MPSDLSEANFFFRRKKFLRYQKVEMSEIELVLGRKRTLGSSNYGTCLTYVITPGFLLHDAS